MEYPSSPLSSTAPSISPSSSRSQRSRNTTPNATPSNKHSKTTPSTSKDTIPSLAQPSPPIKPSRPQKCLQCALLSLPCSISTSHHSLSHHETQPIFCTRCLSSSEEFCILQLPLRSSATEAVSSENGMEGKDDEDTHTLGKKNRSRVEYYAPCVHPEVLRKRVQELLNMTGANFAPREEAAEVEEQEEGAVEMAGVPKFEYIAEVRGREMEVRGLIEEKEKQIAIEEEKKRQIELERERKQKKKTKKRRMDLGEFETY